MMGQSKTRPERVEGSKFKAYSDPAHVPARGAKVIK